MKQKMLRPTWFDRPTTIVARELIGKFIVVRTPRGEMALPITETEAYDGHSDQASHASRGMTKRNAPMFDRAGIWYVYLVYGMYEMLNIVTREKGYPAAVLIRGAGGYNGPGKLTKALGITRRKYNAKHAARTTGLWIEDRGARVPVRAIKQTPRIGIDYAEPKWRKKPWRFLLTENFF